MARRRHGRVRVAFATLQQYAAAWISSREYAPQGEGWELSRASSLHRRKDGSYTLCLIWRSGDRQFSSTIRGLVLEAS